MPPKKASSKEEIMASCKGVHSCGLCEECKFLSLALEFLSDGI